MMFKILSISLLLGLSPFKEKNGNDTGTITIKFSGIEKEKGYVELTLFNNYKGFPSNKNIAFRKFRIKVEPGPQFFSIKDIPFGEYAISCFYDENNNKKLDTNFFGIPKEKIGTSNNSSNSSIPLYEEAKFNFDSPHFQLPITIK